jgi:hypothetical protein
MVQTIPQQFTAGYLRLASIHLLKQDAHPYCSAVKNHDKVVCGLYFMTLL